MIRIPPAQKQGIQNEGIEAGGARRAHRQHRNAGVLRCRLHPEQQRVHDHARDVLRRCNSAQRLPERRLALRVERGDGGGHVGLAVQAREHSSAEGDEVEVRDAAGDGIRGAGGEEYGDGEAAAVEEVSELEHGVEVALEGAREEADARPSMVAATATTTHFVWPSLVFTVDMERKGGPGAD